MFEDIIQKSKRQAIFQVAGAIFILTLIIYNFSLMTHGLSQFLDKTMLLFVVSFAIIYAFAFTGRANFIEKFGEGALRGGWIFAIMGLIVVTNSPFFGELHFGEIGMSFATSVLYVLYGYILRTLSALLA
jgi:hypothetical protein